MRLGRPDKSEGVSLAFTAVPAALLSEFAHHGYRSDPVLGRMGFRECVEGTRVIAVTTGNGKLQTLRRPIVPLFGECIATPRNTIASVCHNLTVVLIHCQPVQSLHRRGLGV
jgi:hypothetical protein